MGNSKDFHRIHIGIGRPENRSPDVVAKYVLSNFEQEEMDEMDNQDMLINIYSAIQSLQK